VDPLTDDQRREQKEMTRQVIDKLTTEHAAKPAEVTYELRSDPYWHDKPIVIPVRDEQFERAPGTLWERAVWAADLLTATAHPDVYRIEVYTDYWSGRETSRTATYVVSHGNQWRDETGHMHQISSSGFCWDCLQPDPDLDYPQRGLIRHPVTPGELDSPPYACFVCKLDTTIPNMAHELTDHTVIWGEEAHPRCTSCGLGYQTANPGGTDYEPHARTCPEMRGE
jgi:hypothetical protein